MEEMRIQKYLSDCGVMSRRAAEVVIAEGGVRVNGKPAVTGQKVKPGVDRVEYKGKTILPPEAGERVCIMLNKPRGYITSMSDDKGRNTVAELVSDVGRRVYPIGRLDYDSEGLLLLTNDGELANRLTHPAHDIPKVYHVRVGGDVGTEKLNKLCRPMTIDGYKIRPVETTILTKSEKSTVLRMTLYEGRNRQIRKMCEYANLSVRRLCRVAVGSIQLGNLKPGEWKYLTRAQIKYLETEHSQKG